MTATTFPTTHHFPRRAAVAAMAALALAGGVTAGITIVDDNDAPRPVPAVAEPLDKDAFHLQNSRSLGGQPVAPQPADPQPANKDEIRLQNLQSLDDSAGTGGATTQLRFGPA